MGNTSHSQSNGSTPKSSSTPARIPKLRKGDKYLLTNDGRRVSLKDYTLEPRKQRAHLTVLKLRPGYSYSVVRSHIGSKWFINETAVKRNKTAPKFPVKATFMTSADAQKFI